MSTVSFAIFEWVANKLMFNTPMKDYIFTAALSHGDLQFLRDGRVFWSEHIHAMHWRLDNICITQYIPEALLSGRS